MIKNKKSYNLLGSAMHRVFALVFFTIFVVFTSVANAAVDFSTPASHAILIDTKTGAILLDKKADERMPTSSMSKVMTMYAVFKAIEDGRLNLNDTLKVSEKAWKKGGSKMFVEVGKEVKVEDLIRGVIIQSGNDATIVLAEGLMGSEDVFAESITQLAQSIGMENSQFKNASGWPDPNHYSTARDLATLAERLMADFPQHYHYYSEKEFEFNNIKQPNRNPLLFRNMGVDGIKTGHTEVGGYGLMASGERNGRRLILVVNGLDSEQQRASESARILEWGFNSFENKRLFRAGETVGEANVIMGLDETVELEIAEDIEIALYKTQKDDLKVSYEYEGPLKAPVERGQEVGRLVIEAPGMQKMTYSLNAKNSVPELGLVPKVMTKVKFLLFGRF